MSQHCELSTLPIRIETRHKLRVIIRSAFHVIYTSFIRHQSYRLFICLFIRHHCIDKGSLYWVVCTSLVVTHRNSTQTTRHSTAGFAGHLYIIHLNRAQTTGDTIECIAHHLYVTHRNCAQTASHSTESLHVIYTSLLKTLHRLRGIVQWDFHVIYTSSSIKSTDCR